ncbi:conserved hypothetical protein [Trichinella spiralis]|uniref:hypothetical protein n=1 Tax=Trichinella spiralis TaxID=6334 RepID=UPI0001EFD93C|nr:conserved hypothetical protein [Trichinella spiralis]
MRMKNGIPFRDPLENNVIESEQQCMVKILKFMRFVSKFVICNYFLGEGSVRNAYLSVTEEEREHFHFYSIITFLLVKCGSIAQDSFKT